MLTVAGMAQRGRVPSVSHASAPSRTPSRWAEATSPLTHAPMTADTARVPDGREKSQRTPGPAVRESF